MTGFVVITPVPLTVNRKDGSAYPLAPGRNDGVPEDVATSWYARAAGCTVAPIDAAAKATNPAKGRRK